MADQILGPASGPSRHRRRANLLRPTQGAPLPYSGCAEAILEGNNRSSAGYRPATLPLDSLVGSLAARPIASFGPYWVIAVLTE
jgi:hypothetical protein